MLAPPSGCIILEISATRCIHIHGLVRRLWQSTFWCVKIHSNWNKYSCGTNACKASSYRAIFISHDCVSSAELESQQYAWPLWTLQIACSAAVAVVVVVVDVFVSNCHVWIFLSSAIQLVYCASNMYVVWFNAIAIYWCFPRVDACVPMPVPVIGPTLSSVEATRVRPVPVGIWDRYTYSWTFHLYHSFGILL